ncbi:hypothetical protein RJD24_18985 [Bacillaceae bacterium IKA-2]|nr:hypothetical protein RJD24_18985 [Bacillaceae bacterium IKA-2]
MILKKVITTIGIVSIIAIVSACGSDSKAQVGGGTPDNPIYIGETVENREQATEFSHIHGLSRHPSDSNKLLLASHYGLIEYDQQSSEASFIGSERFDLMGYARIPGSNIIMTSGHPGEGSNLPDPLGFLWSEDFGETWEVRGLHAMIDFHSLAATSDASKILGYGSDLNKSVIFESYDQGYTWKVVKSKGVTLDHEEFFALGMAPDNGDIAYAATSKGLFYSSDGGVNWEKIIDGYITALKVIGEDEVVFYEASKNGLFRLQGEESHSYDLYLGADAVNYIVVAEDSSAVTVSTFQNNLSETTNHGETWETLLEEGIFRQ